MKRLLILLALIPVLILAACSDFGLKGDEFNPAEEANDDSVPVIETTPSDHFLWNLVDTVEYSVTGFSAGYEDTTVISIPSTYNGKPVTAIAADAFFDSSLVTVVIPDSVTSIGNWAFEESYDLTSLTIPASVTSIGSNIVYYCESLASITVADANAHYCAVDGVLFNEAKTTLVAYPIGKTATSYEIPATVTDIGIRAFAESNNLVSVSFPDGLETIGDSAFEYTLIESVSLPDTITAIGALAFSYCDSLALLSINATTPPALSDDSFEGHMAGFAIEVPAAVEGDYIDAPGWDYYDAMISEQTTAVTFSSAVQDGGVSGTTTTTSLTLTFSVDPTTLAASDITLTGATKGALSGTGTTRSLAISAITVANGETVSVAVASPSGFTVSGSPKTAVVYKAVVTAQMEFIAGQASTGNVDATGALAKFGTTMSGIVIDSAGNAYVCDQANWSIRKVTPAGVVTTIVANSALFYQHKSIVIDSSGNLFVASYGRNMIIKVTPAGAASVFAGSGNNMSEADGTGILADFYGPWGLAIDSSDNLYVSTREGNKIRKITPAAVVTTLAGSGANASTNATGTAAAFSQPSGLVIDSAGNLFVWDCGFFGKKIRKITSAGVVTTFAGSGTAAYADGTGTAASFWLDNGGGQLSIDSDDNIFVPDTWNFRIRKVTPAAVVTTVTGTGTSGYLEGDLLSAQFVMPFGMAFNSSGVCYIADEYRIRKMTQ